MTVLEPDAELCASLMSTFETSPQVDVYHGDLNQFCDDSDTTGFFDDAIYINVLEHIGDDVEELIRVRSTLIDVGKIVIFVPTVPSLYGPTDGESAHFRRYSKRKLIAVVNAAGYEVEKCAYFDPLGVAVYFIMYRIFGISRSGTGSVFVYDKILLPFSELIARITPHRLLGKNLILTARISNSVAINASRD